MRSATATGRRLEESTNLLVPIMRRLLEHPLTARAARHTRALALVAAVLVFLRQAARGKRAKESLEAEAEAIKSAAPDAAKSSEDADAGAKNGKGAEAVGKGVTFGDLLRTEDGRMSVGLPDFGAVMVASALSAYAMLYKGSLLARLMQAQNAQDSAAWTAAAVQYPLCCVLAGALQTSFGYFKSRFSLQWRHIVTQKLHSLYFANISYYRVMNSQSVIKMDDPDIRICQDVQQVCEAYSNIAVLMANSVLMAFILSRAMKKPPALAAPAAQAAAAAAGRDWRWSLVPPIFTLVFVPAAFAMFGQAPLSWVHGFLSSAKSRYEQVLTRVQLHGERICMLQGEKYELGILNRCAQAEAYWDRYSFLANSPREQVQALIFSEHSVGMVPQVGMFTGFMILVSRLRQPGGRAAERVMDQEEPVPELASDVGGAIQDNWTVMYSIGAFGSLIGALVGLGYTKASGDRVTELYAVLKNLQSTAPQQQEQGERAFEDRGPVISFEGVTVQTPTEQTLLQGLSFAVKPGETLLISGHNGAGKSSIIRCLCNLWPVPAGRIARPGGAVHAEEDVRLHEQVYYLPQKPVSVLGSLSDQLTYPVRLPGGLPEAELRRWLRYVDLEYLLERVPARGAGGPAAAEEGGGRAGSEADRDWEALLSLGEQQALSIARLLYHRPRFAILDECTSAVSKGLERRLFELAQELGMACLTITHRPALQEHHMRALRLTGTLESDGRGWVSEDLPRCRELAAGRRPECAGAAEAQERIEALLARCPSKGAGATVAGGEALQRARLDGAESPGAAAARLDLQAEVRRRWPNSLQRFAGVLRLGLQEPALERKCRRQALLLLGLGAARCWLVWDIWLGIGSAIRAALTGDVTGIWAALLTNAVLSPLNALVDHNFTLTGKTLCLDLWANVKCHLHTRALGTGAFLRVMRPADPRVPHVENPVQQVAEARELFNSLRSCLEPVLLTSSLAAYSLRTLVGGGGVWTLVILGGSFALFGLCQAQAPDWKYVTKQMQNLETRLQVLHTRLRHVAEPVAFSGGGGAERRVIEPRFEAVCAFRRKALRDEFLYNWMMAVFSSYDLLPMGVQRLLAWNFAARNMPNHEHGVSPRVVSANLMYDRSIQFCQMAEMKIVTFVPEWQRMDGRFLRLLELVAAFDAADAAADEASPTASAATAPAVEQSELSVQKLDLITPTGTCLAKGIDFDLREGSPLLVTGPNASGKSLMGCMLLGLLTPTGAKARVLLPGLGALGASTRAPLEVMMAVPQRVYLPLGTLGDQVCYPYRYVSLDAGDAPSGADGVNEDKMLAALRAAGIEHLLKREAKGWLARRTWEDALSGGEQQRMGLARVFFRMPRFALLDECTSMVASAAEEGLYRTLVRDFGITPLTLTQRLFMPDLYPNELRLGQSSVEGWSLVGTEGIAAT